MFDENGNDDSLGKPRLFDSIFYGLTTRQGATFDDEGNCNVKRPIGQKKEEGTCQRPPDQKRIN